MPSIARPRTHLPQPPCNHRPEFQHPAAHVLVGDVEPALGKLLIGAGPVPSLTGTYGQIAKQQNVNACAILAPRVDGMRPGLRAQFPVPTAPERANRRAQAPQRQ